jgi:pimeloyl-ACP methyl ester carboxylesterase
MATRGWNTLSIQMPILPNEATYEEYVPLYPEVPPRLQAAEDFLISQGIKDIVIVAHSQGATMSAYYLSRHDHQVRGFVAIGMQASQPDPAINAANSLKLIRIPVLDLYGSEDLAEVLNTIQLRKDAAAQNTGYKQKMVKGADHFFVTKNTPLIETIDEWLNSANLF